MRHRHGAAVARNVIRRRNHFGQPSDATSFFGYNGRPWQVISRPDRKNSNLALRLGKYFDTTPELWLNDLRCARARDWHKVEPRVRVLAAK
jgi:hypothetical protein